MDSTTIYVQILDENVDVWRPVQAVHEGGDRYRILSENAAPDEEHWEFTTGTVVRCASRRLSDGAALVAIERADA